MRELTPAAIIVGVIVSVIFGAANAYIGLRVGQTVASSIPSAVIGFAIYRAILKRVSISENNIVQTIGSAGTSLASGMIFVLPALFIFANDPDNPVKEVVPGKSMIPTYWEMVVWGVLGGLLGVIFMVPLRRMLIVKEHGKLMFPEGVACAEVLKSGAHSQTGGGQVFGGILVGGVFEFIRRLGFFPDTAAQPIPLLRTQASLAAEPALLGVGYIIGPRIAAYMLGGAILGSFVLIPSIVHFSGDSSSVIWPATAPISQLSYGDIHNKFVKYIGAGAVVFGGILSLIRSFRTIGGSFMHVIGGRTTGDRTDRDIPSLILLLMILGIAAAMYYFEQFSLNNLIVIGSVIVFSMFFVTVSSRLVGQVGSSSLPASAMTIATILGTALVFLNLAGGRLSPSEMKFAIISVGALVCIAICIAGDTSQDLKTGFLVQATPWKQQVAMIIGIVTAVFALAGIIWALSHYPGYVKDAQHPNAAVAPQANIIKLIVQGIIDHQLPWGLILTGVAVALIVEMLGVPCLPFATGLYLPFGLSAPIMVGGIVRWIVDLWRGRREEGEDPGVLGASGLVAGQGVIGVSLVAVAAAVNALMPTTRFLPTRLDPDTHEVRQPARFVSVEQPATTSPSAPASSSAAEESLPLTTEQTWEWVSAKTGIHPHYALHRLPHEAGPFRDAYQFDYFNLLPLLPFLFVTVWLLRVAIRTGPRRSPPFPHPPMQPRTPPDSRAPSVGQSPPPSIPDRVGPGSTTGASTAMPPPIGGSAPPRQQQALPPRESHLRPSSGDVPGARAPAGPSTPAPTGPVDPPPRPPGKQFVNPETGTTANVPDHGSASWITPVEAQRLGYPKPPPLPGHPGAQAPPGSQSSGPPVE